MSKVLIVGCDRLIPDLGRTILWRSDIERVFAPDSAAAMEVARVQMPNLILIDGADAQPTAELLHRLREEPSTRSVSVAVVSRHPSLPEKEILRHSGANVVLTGRPDPFLWDDRLEELLHVPRRREARIPARVEIWSRFGADDESVEALVLNIGPRGMLVETREPLDVGAKLELSFGLPDQPEPLKAVGQVVREASAAAGDPYRFGVEFLLLRADARDRIEAFVDAEACS
jgi:DNA-binding response OmpR family regulator